MKREKEINKLLKILSENPRKDYFARSRSFVRLISHSMLSIRIKANPKLGKPVLTIMLLLLGLKSLAPVSSTLTIFDITPVRPFNSLMYAVGMVETMGNSFAYNEFEDAVGIFQIRQVRVDDYNRRTGCNLKLEDMFDDKVSEKVFLYFATLIGPYQIEKIARAWNGSGPMTDFYWSRIKSYL
ncbi:MAG: hypothetical protein Q8868_12775 [Bacteroidota bacterium]|nr:hypothetical protein [Bacteroidota bacterium]